MTETCAGDADAELLRLGHLWTIAVADREVLRGHPDSARADDADNYIFSLERKIEAINCSTTAGAELKLSVALRDALIEAELPGRYWTLSVSWALVQDAREALKEGEVIRAAVLLRSALDHAERDLRQANAKARSAGLEPDSLDLPWRCVEDALAALTVTGPSNRGRSAGRPLELEVVVPPARNGSKSPERSIRLSQPKRFDYREKDAPIIEKMRSMIEQGSARGPTDAARALAKEAVGYGTEDSKKTRLLRHYAATYRSSNGS